jgi:hypothetical protein
VAVGTAVGVAEEAEEGAVVVGAEGEGGNA